MKRRVKVRWCEKTTLETSIRSRARTPERANIGKPTGIARTTGIPHKSKSHKANRGMGDKKQQEPYESRDSWGHTIHLKETEKDNYSHNQNKIIKHK